MRTSKTSKILVAAVSAVVVLVLLAALSPLLVPLLPARVQQFIGGSIDTATMYTDMVPDEAELVNIVCDPFEVWIAENEARRVDTCSVD